MIGEYGCFWRDERVGVFESGHEPEDVAPAFDDFEDGRRRLVGVVWVG